MSNFEFYSYIFLLILYLFMTFIQTFVDYRMSSFRIQEEFTFFLIVISIQFFIMNIIYHSFYDRARVIEYEYGNFISFATEVVFFSLLTIIRTLFLLSKAKINFLMEEILTIKPNNRKNYDLHFHQNNAVFFVYSYVVGSPTIKLFLPWMILSGFSDFVLTRNHEFREEFIILSHCKELPFKEREIILKDLEINYFYSI